MRVVFRVDAGRRHGLALGHAVRCMELARELDRFGVASSFLTRHDPLGSAFLARYGHPVETLPADVGASDEIARVARIEADAVVVDTPEGLRLDLAAVRAERRGICVIDDVGGGDFAADLLVNGSLAASMRQYPARPGQRRLLGPDFIVLGPDFDAPNEVEPGEPKNSILVTFGGADPAGLTLAFARALSERGPGPLRYDVVAGPANMDADAIAEAISRYRGDAVLHRDAPSLSALMRRADLALAAGGRTAYELAALGVPAVLVASHPNEKPIVEALAAEGAARAAPGPIDALDHLADMAADAAARREMKETAAALVDGGGRRRVATAIRELIAST